MINLIVGFLVLIISFYPHNQNNETIDLGCQKAPTIESVLPEDLYEPVSRVLIFNTKQLSFQFAQFVGIPLNPNLPDLDLPLVREAIDNGASTSLSPDRSQLLQRFFTEERTPIIVLTPLYDTDDETIVYGEESWLITGHYAPFWLNNNVVIVSTSVDPSTYRSYTYTLMSAVDGQTNNIQLSIPQELGLSVDPVYGPALSPDQNGMAYIQFVDEVNALVIFNLDSLDYTVTHLDYFVNAIEWSPGSNYVLITQNSDSSNGPQLMSVFNTDGQVVANIALHPSLNVAPSYGFQWSPDGEKLLYRDGETEFQEAIASFPKVVDLRTGEITEICLPGEAFWSPDSSYIFVFVKTESTVAPFVYEIETNKLYELDFSNPDAVKDVLGWANTERQH